MKKIKIAISLDQPLLNIIDSKVDSSVIRSRSQAIEHFLKEGLKKELIDYAVIFLKGEHQKYVLQEIKGKLLIKHHLDLIESAGINKVIIVTQHSTYSNELEKETQKSKLNVRIVEKDVHGTAEALYSIKDMLEKKDFFAMSGDIYADFSISAMISKHFEYDKIGTIGLISSPSPELAGSVALDGFFITDFKEKSNDINGLFV